MLLYCHVYIFVSLDVSDDLTMEIDNNEDVNNQQQKHIDNVKLTSEQVVTLIDAMIVDDKKYNDHQQIRMAIIDTTNTFYTIGMYELEKDNNATSELYDVHLTTNILSHLSAVKQLCRSTEQHEFGCAFNVYTDAPPTREVCLFIAEVLFFYLQLHRLCTQLTQLKTDAASLFDKYPDMDALRSIMLQCEKLMSIGAATPLLQLAAHIERLLGECCQCYLL